MRSSRKIVLGLIAPWLLVQWGCTSLTGTRPDGVGGDGTAQSNPFDIEQWPKQLESSWKTLIGKGVNPQKARELYVDAEGKYQEALRAESDQKLDLFAQAATKWPTNDISLQGRPD